MSLAEGGTAIFNTWLSEPWESLAICWAKAVFLFSLRS